MNDMQKFDNRNTIEVVPHGGTPSCQTPSAMIELAITRGADLEKLEKLMELQERWDRNEAKKDYVKAVADFKANMPKVFKDKENTQYKSMYASESALLNTLNPVLSQHGLSAGFSFPDSDSDLFKVTCTMTHENGYSDSVTLKGPLDTSGSKNPLQQVKSTVTYLRKATFEAIIGIATSDRTSDDDGNAAGEYINEKQISSIVDFINEKEANQTLFLKYMKAESLETILASDFGKAIKALKAKKKPMREPGSDDN